MIDTAIPDTIAEGLINFDKRRKEFEVLARIRLLQGAANAYNFTKDPIFDQWFHSIVVLDDREAYKLSCQIEIPPPGHTLNNRIPHKKKQVGFIIFKGMYHIDQETPKFGFCNFFFENNHYLLLKFLEMLAKVSPVTFT